MIKIVILGEADDTRIASILSQKIQSKYDMIQIYENVFEQTGDVCDYLVIDSKHIHNIQAKSSIVIFKDNFNANQKICIHKDAIVVVNADNKRIIDLISEYDIQVATCGLSAKNTFTLSSNQEDSVVVALQYSICTLNGKIIDPIEIPVKNTHKLDHFTILASVATLILTDNLELCLNS